MKKKPTEEALGDQYEAAMEEWYASGEVELWEAVIGDGLEDEPEWRQCEALPPLRVTDS